MMNRKSRNIALVLLTSSALLAGLSGCTRSGNSAYSRSSATNRTMYHGTHYRGTRSYGDPSGASSGIRGGGSTSTGIHGGTTRGGFGSHGGGFGG